MSNLVDHGRVSRLRIAVLVRRVGAYHRARLAALAKRADTLVVETCAVDATYAWGCDEGTGSGFERVTLFGTEAEAADLGALRAGLDTALDRFEPEAVAVPGWGDPAALLGLAFASRARQRGGGRIGRILMSDSQAMDAPRRLLTETVKRAVVSFADAGLVAGSTHADYLAALGLPRERIALGYDVVDNAHFSRGADATRAEMKGCDPAWPAFLSLTRFVAKKNVVTLVNAYARYARAARAEGEVPWGLVLVGDGPERAAIEGAAAASGEAVEIRPFASYDELPALYARAGALVVPSSVEQWGLVVNEAMAAGCPVLVSNRAGAAAELVDDGVTGLVTSPEEAALATSLVRMARADRTVLVANARARIADWGPERFRDGMLAAAEAARMGRRTPLPPIMLPCLAARLLAADTTH